MINKTTIKVPKKYEHMVDCISLGLRHKSGSSYYVYVSQGYAGIDSISGRMVTFAILFGQKKAMKFIRSIGPVEEGSETCEAESAEAVVEAPSPECAAAMETAVPSDAPQAPVDTQAEAAVVDGGERLGRASFVVVFSNGERLEFYQPCTWTSISRLVKWRLQMEDELSVARVYAGPVADDVYYVRTYAGGRSVADFHKRARNRAHIGPECANAMETAVSESPAQAPEAPENSSAVVDGGGVRRKNCLERNAENHTAEKIASFRVKQQQPYEFKIAYAQARAWEFYNECGARDLNCHVSVGGLDSITLYLFLQSIGIKVPAISVSCLEDASIQRVHKQLGIERLSSAMREDGKPWTKPQILQEFGFPVLSKETASKIELLQNPSPKNATVRHAIITGETGWYGGNRTGTRMKLSQKWLEKFGGYENERECVDYQIPPFKVSSKCCYYLKEKPCDDWARAHHSAPYLGLMASEHGRREKSLMANGCNYFGKNTIRSAPFAIFDRQDLLQLALDLDVPVPEIYGAIERRTDGSLYTTGAQRTGCSMCGFGIHLEKRPHRFDRLYERSPKEWEFWMNRCCHDEDGTPYGWGRVLDYIGVGWRPESLSADLVRQSRLKCR